MSVRSIVCEPFVVFVFVLTSSVGVQRRDEFIPTLGSGGPQWGPVKVICLYVFPYVSPSLHLSVWSSVSLFGDHSRGL